MSRTAGNVWDGGIKPATVTLSGIASITRRVAIGSSGGRTFILTPPFFVHRRVKSRAQFSYAPLYLYYIIAYTFTILFQSFFFTCELCTEKPHLCIISNWAIIRLLNALCHHSASQVKERSINCAERRNHVEAKSWGGKYNEFCVQWQCRFSPRFVANINHGLVGWVAA
jgi:hypothetical protein